MNEFMWAQILQNKLDMMDIYNRTRIVVHSVHRNVISFEMRNVAVPVVSFGRIAVKSEYVGLEVERGLCESSQILRNKVNIWHDNQIKRKQIK